MALSYSQLKGLWIKAGGNPDDADVMAAIAMAESGGRPEAHNPNAATGDNSFGLWQINMLGNMGPERRKRWGLSSDRDLFDPLTNAKAAVSLSSGGKNKTPWTMFTNGKYRDFLTSGVTPDMNAGGALDGVVTPTSFEDDVAGLFKPIWQMFGNVGNKVYFSTLIILGALLMMIGLLMLVRETPVPGAFGAFGKAAKVIGGVK